MPEKAIVTGKPHACIAGSKSNSASTGKRSRAGGAAEAAAGRKVPHPATAIAAARRTAWDHIMPRSPTASVARGGGAGPRSWRRRPR